jgi:hypothetical protein
MNLNPLRTARALVGAYLVLSVLTVVALVVLSATAPHLVTNEAWGRGVILAATSILTFGFATRAAKGSARALRGLRVVVVILLVSVLGVLFFLPLPWWMRIEQAACGALLLATAVLVFRRPAVVGAAESSPTDSVVREERA